MDADTIDIRDIIVAALRNKSKEESIEVVPSFSYHHVYIKKCDNCYTLTIRDNQFQLWHSYSYNLCDPHFFNRLSMHMRSGKEFFIKAVEYDIYCEKSLDRATEEILGSLEVPDILTYGHPPLLS